MRTRCAIGALMLTGSSAWGGISDDFESYDIGQAPSGIWRDVVSYIDDPTNPGPTVSVIQTTDAFGGATRAMQIDGAGIGSSGGIAAQVQHSRYQRFETDLRLDRGGNGSNPNWIAASGFFQETDQSDFNWMPQAFVYATRGSSRFRLYVRNADGRTGASRDFGLGAHAWSFDAWYRIVLEVDTETGVFDATIVDLASGETIVDATRTYAGWNSVWGRYDTISVNDGEYGSNPGSIGNIATIDNIGYAPAPGTAVVVLGAAMVGARRRR